MGLDFHTEGIPYEEDIPFEDRAHWSYSGFHKFRERLAQTISLEHWAHKPLSSLLIDSNHNPLCILLAHSDCDGILTPTECEVVGKALASAVWDWEPKDDYDRINAIKLAAHMHHCACNGRNLEFR